MKIVKLTAENIKKLKAVTIEPKDNVVLITGKNGAGKTSVLDSILYALCGGKELPQMPIREGEKKANITLQLDEIEVIRTFTEKGSYLEIHNKEGFKASSPQALLDKIVGKVSFDPLTFINEPEPRKQRQILMNLAGLNFTDTDHKIAQLREERKLLGFEHNRLKVEAELDEELPEAPLQEINISDLATELQAANEHNKALDKEQGNLNTATFQLSHAENGIQMTTIMVGRLKKELEEAEAELKKLNNERRTHAEAVEIYEKRIKDFKPIDIKFIQTKIEIAQNNNRLVQKVATIKKVREAFQQKAQEYDAKTKEIDTLEQQKKDTLHQAKMPVDGLSINDDGVLFRGIPLKQTSAAEQLRIGVAVSMALNPTLRVLRITDGSLLDSDNLAAISQMVKDGDYQVWIERVDESGKVGLYIEDGEIKNQ